METPTPSPSPESPLPSSIGACWRSRWAQRLSWLISALSGTLEIEAAHKQKMQEYEQRKTEHEQRMKELDRDNERLDRMILQTKNEIKQIEKENDRLHELESKIDGLFLKYDINSPLAQKPEQP
jgi:exonuclease VII large subunit